MSMGLATIGLDRFAGLAQWRNLPAGKVVTKPLTVPQSHLAVNVEYFEQTPIRMALTTPAGNAIPGYTLEDSRIEMEIRRTYSMARWKDKPDLRGKQVVLHFEIRGAALYSFRFYSQV